MAESNPYGANSIVLDPRQKLCWEHYINPNSDTFGNALQSALKAGYEYNYANNITKAEWFSQKLLKLNLLIKAEKVLDETLEMSTTTIKKQGDEEILVVDPALMKIKQDTAKFIAETVGKSTYSKRSEITGKDGGSLVNNLKELSDDELIAITNRGTSGIGQEGAIEKETA